MTKYGIKTSSGEVIAIDVVKNQSWGGGMQVLKYESPGSNGGIVIVTGRMTNEITLSGRFIVSDSKAIPMEKLSKMQEDIMRIKDRGEPIFLIAPITNNDSGMYVISEFTGSVEEGAETSIPWMMKLTEHRQTNLKHTIVNLIALGPAEEFKTILDLVTQGRA
jgi:hypothetical protein